MVRICTLCRLILQATFDILAAKYCVGLKSLLPTKPITVDICITLSRDIEKFKCCTLPVVVAAIHQLVNASIEATFLANLPLAQPLSAPIKV